jgi:hypothetical protein
MLLIWSRVSLSYIHIEEANCHEGGTHNSTPLFFNRPALRKFPTLYRAMMMWMLAPLGLWLASSCVAEPEVFDLGELDQYKSKQVLTGQAPS